MDDYPGDAKWWAQEEARARLMNNTRDAFRPRGMTDSQQELYELIDIGEEISGKALRDMTGKSESQIRCLMNGMTMEVPVYEYEVESTGGRRQVMYGLLEGA